MTLRSGVKVGQIGTGGISYAHLPGWMALQVELGAYSNTGAEEYAQRSGAQIFGSLEALLDWCDVVDIATPTPTHHELVLAAVAAGKPIFCEKPLARTSEHAREMIAAAEAAGTMLYPAHVVRFFPAYATAWQAVREGRIGELAVQRYRRDSARPTWSRWFDDFDQSGGVVLDLLIHDLDIARWIGGPVVQVSGSVVEQDGQQLATAILTHESGCISQIRGIWGAESLPFRTGFELAGSEGRLRHDSLAQGRTQARGDVAEGLQGLPSLPEIDPYFAEITDFLAAVYDATTPRITAADGLRAVRLAEAVTQSATSGQPVAFEDEEA